MTDTEHAQRIMDDIKAMLDRRNSTPIEDKPGEPGLSRETARRLADRLLGLAGHIVHCESLGKCGDEAKTERAVNKIHAARSNINHPYDK